MIGSTPIYADYNATTPVDEEVLEEMLPFLRKRFGNASSSHLLGKQARQAVDEARRRVAAAIGCGPNEIIFTSGGSESNNLAIKGVAFKNKERGRHIITSTIEHPSVLNPCRYLEDRGFDVTYLPVDEYGLVSVEDLSNAIQDETVLITIMHANNEVGTIEPISEVGRLAKELGIYFHTDAAQSLGKIPVDVGELGVDLLTIAGHKLYAPKGVGALYVRAGTRLEPLIHGAAHEFGLRAGTEAVASIVALGKACEMAEDGLDLLSLRLTKFRERLFQLLLMGAPGLRLNGHPADHLPNTLNIGFPGVTGAVLLKNTPEVAASPGSACHADATEISPVLSAMGVAQEYALGAIRLSLGKYTTEDEIDVIADALCTSYIRLLDGDLRKANN
ncbi:MAG: cysteine desulfurase family protein [Candidatus Aquicultor sp.]|nr:cysteine desulfurase family protein [Candidatus Aquicultor sp.]